MNKIYIVKGDLVSWDYAIKGVYSSKDKAEKAIQSIIKDYTQEELDDIENYGLENYGLIIEEHIIK